MFICCMNKNPWFIFDQKAQKYQKRQILKSAKIQKKKKMHENVQYDQKERVKVSYLRIRKKTFDTLTKKTKKKNKN